MDWESKVILLYPHLNLLLIRSFETVTINQGVRHYVFLFAVISISFTGKAQNYVDWSFEYDGTQGAVVFGADIEEGWHLYSQNVTNEFGPIPTEFSFIENGNFELVGKTAEPDPIKEYDPNFEEELHFFEDHVVFVQPVTVRTETIIEGTVTYMVCNDSMCMPPIDVEFRIDVK